MSAIRKPKVRVTDYRQPGAGVCSPLEISWDRPKAAASQKTPWDFMDDNNKRAGGEHDKMVAGLPLVILQAAAKDLGGRRAWNKENPEHRWIMARMGALGREIGRRNSPRR